LCHAKSQEFEAGPLARKPWVAQPSIRRNAHPGVGVGQFKRYFSCELCSEPGGDDCGREVLTRSPHEKNRVADDGEAAQEHGRQGDKRIQQPGHCYGDGYDVVKALGDKVQADFSVRPSYEREEIENSGEISTHEGDVACFLAKRVSSYAA
jgi:hypothetical protein